MTMNSKKDISDILKQSYFWDIVIKKEKSVSKRLVIERIFSLGTFDEVVSIIKYYGKKETEKVLLDLNYMDPKTLNFVSKYLGRSKTEFRCYTRKQSMPQLWNS
jgi:hypothetical protein